MFNKSGSTHLAEKIWCEFNILFILYTVFIKKKYLYSIVF